MRKNRSKKTLMFEKWQHFENGRNWPRCMGPCKTVSLAQKLKMPKRCEKRLYHHIKVVVCKKPLQKTPHIRKMTAFWKWPQLATMQNWPRCILPMQKGQFGSKIKNAKKVRKTIVPPHLSCCVQKTAPKNTSYSKNDSILKMAKIGHDAWAIAHAKWSVWVKN